MVKGWLRVDRHDILCCRFTSGESVVLYKAKGKSQGGPEVHLSGMTQLTGKSSCQTFMLKLLKVIIDLRGTARTSLRTKSGMFFCGF